MRPCGRQPRALQAVALAAGLALAGCTGDPAPVPSAPPPGAAPSQATPVLAGAVTGGTTQVVADPAFLEGLARLGLAPRVTGQAGFAGATGTFSFPVTGGRVSLPAGGGLRGQVRHDGSGLLLTSGTSSVSLDDLVLDGDAGEVRATVAVDGAVRAEDAPVLDVDDAAAQAPSVDGPGGAAVLRGLRVTLTAQGAELLNAALAPEGFAPGAAVGAVTLTLQPTAP